LVNGARGTVKAIWFSPGKNPRYELPTVIWVEFPEYNGPTNPRFGQEYIQPHWVPLTPSTARWENRGDQQLSRTQYPLITAWAITIHKSQGLTLDEAVIELGPADFSPGLVFVALSRIKTLKGLAIRSACGMARFAKPTSDTARMLAEDNERRQVLEQGFQLNEYGVDLSYWKQGFI
jgi:ATP-dependent exoDNAse (exonuclease V) alpha subunit